MTQRIKGIHNPEVDNCGSCACWRQLTPVLPPAAETDLLEGFPEPDGLIVPRAPVNLGQCRLLPPSYYRPPVTETTQSGEVRVLSPGRWEWPIMEEEDDCHQHRPRPSAEELEMENHPTFHHLRCPKCYNGLHIWGRCCSWPNCQHVHPDADPERAARYEGPCKTCGEVVCSCADKTPVQEPPSEELLEAMGKRLVEEYPEMLGDLTGPEEDEHLS